MNMNNFINLNWIKNWITVRLLQSHWPIYTRSRSLWLRLSLQIQYFQCGYAFKALVKQNKHFIHHFTKFRRNFRSVGTFTHKTSPNNWSSLCWIWRSQAQFSRRWGVRREILRLDHEALRWDLKRWVSQPNW